MHRFTALALLAAVAAAQSHDKLNAILWAQTSVEYEANARQAFAAARLALEEARKDKRWTAALEQREPFKRKPPAIILDVDETILDNSPANVRFLEQGISFDRAAWSAWVGEARAKAIPGAVDFIRYAQSKGVTVFYVTNRSAAEEQGTKANLEREGFPVVGAGALGDTLLLLGERPEWTGDKTTRRAAVAERHRVLLLVGDDLNDFLTGVRTSVEERRKTASTYSSYWGRRWIIVPNATYGSWEDSLHGFDRSLPAERILELKRKALDRGERGRPAAATK